MSQTVILQSDEILVIEQSDPVGIATTEIETILVTTETEIIVLEVAEQGPPGAPGSAMTNGPGIVIVGTEIRLSIGTLPQVG